MAHPNVERLRKGYDAFNTGDLDALKDLFTQDVVAHEPGKNPFAGDYKGQDEVFGLFGKYAELSGGTFKVEPHSILADDEHGAVLSFGSAQREGKILNVRSVEVFHFQGDKIAEYWSLIDDVYAYDEFWS
jgi:hypothetical protein